MNSIIIWIIGIVIYLIGCLVNYFLVKKWFEFKESKSNGGLEELLVAFLFLPWYILLIMFCILLISMSWFGTLMLGLILYNEK